MDQRTDSPVRFNHTVTITAFHSDDAVDGRLIDLLSNDMKIKSNADFEVGSLLRLEIGDDLMITEVRHCEPDQGEYGAGLLILSSIEKSELKRLRHEMAGPTPQTVDTVLVA